MEFWQNWVIDKSYSILQELRKKYKFILIGGWAVYFLTKTIKSKDIGMVVDYEELEKMKLELRISKTGFLKKYACEVEGVSIDIYVPYYSKLALPLEEIKKSVLTIEGFKVPRPEIVLILKQQAEIERKHSEKGLKDRVDIIALLLKTAIDFKKYREFLEKYKLNYRKRLIELVRQSNVEFEYLGVKNPGEIKKIKEEIMSRILKPAT